MPADSDSTDGYIWAYAGAFERGTFFVFGLGCETKNPPLLKHFKARSYRPGDTTWSTESGIENYVRSDVGQNYYGNAVGHNGKIYLLGWNSSTPQIIIYDVENKQMLPLGPSDPEGPRRSFAMGIFNGAIFIAGGSTYDGVYDGNPPNQVISSVYRLEVEGNEWQEMTSMPGGDRGQYTAEASAEVEGKWWVRFRDDPTMSPHMPQHAGKVWVYDGSSWQRGGNYPGIAGEHESEDYGTSGEWNCVQFATM